MIPQIAKAISSGFTTKQIIDYLLKKFPNQYGKIKDALAAGYTVDQVVKFLGGGKKALNKHANEEMRSDVNTEYAKTRQKDIERSQTENKGAMAVGGAAVGGLGAGMAAKALSRAVPTSLLEYAQSTQQQPQSIPPTSQSPMGPGPNSPDVQVMGTPQPNIPPQPMPGAPTISQPPHSAQPIIPQRDIKKSVDLIKNIGEEQRIKNLVESGLPAEDIAGVLRKLVGKDKLAALEASEGGLEAIVEDFAQSVQPQDLNQPPPIIEQMPPEIMPEEETQKEDLNVPQETIEPPKPIQKNQIVASPNGVGEVKAIRNGKVLVEVDGRIHQVNEDELIQSPISQDNLADLHEELIKGIEKYTGEEVSKNVEWAGYDPKLNELAYKPWTGGGKIYTYSDISPEDVAELQSILAQRKTSGNNFIGIWEKDTKSPIGNRMHALIQRLQKERGGKGNEYRSKYETIYDPTEPAKKAAQERHKNEKKLKKTR